ncbi:MAG TPA: thiamine phosphate synthase [bacterium]|nr:thiamine phosphate synthase [bacterium]HOL49883.1 thiamine phosphate synthase [bacterium]HPO52436.1 thiamine phosphate synthase [bacterium]
MKYQIEGYYFITDANLTRNGIIKDIKSAIRAGVKIFQYREKNKSALFMYQEAMEIRTLIKDGIFVINDRVDIALAVNADGVHIGQDDLPLSITRRLLGDKKIIGVTVHNCEQAIRAEKEGADYVAVSPIFKTMTKPDAQEPVGLKILAEVKDAVSIPVVAIGGINLENVPMVVKAGADAICAISSVITKENPEVEIEKFQNIFNNMEEK